MLQILPQIGDRDTDIGLLVVNPVEAVALKDGLHFGRRPVADHYVAAHIEQDAVENDFVEVLAEVGAPVLSLPVQRGNKDRMCVGLERRLAELLRAVPGAQIEHTKSRFFEGKLHDAVADDVNIVADYADDDAQLHPATRSGCGASIPRRRNAACLMLLRSSLPALPVMGKVSK